MSIHQAIANAEALLPGEPAPEGESDPRWQAIIKVAEYIEINVEEVWAFAERWAAHEQDDLRMAISTCVLEHLLEYHFDLIFPRIQQLARQNELFADAFGSWCSKFGQSEKPGNAMRFDQLKNEIKGARGVRG